MTLAAALRYTTHGYGASRLVCARYASTKAAESFMAELQASGLTPTEIKSVCTKHPDMLSKNWTPAARKQKIELLKKIEEQERRKASETKPASGSSSSA